MWRRAALRSDAHPPRQDSQHLPCARVGFPPIVCFGSPGLGSGNERFRRRLAEFGYIEGKTIVLDIRYALMSPHAVLLSADEVIE